jgi:large subunit ribosomal protein L24
VSVVVEGINISKRHTKPRQGSTSGIGGVPRIEPGGILDVNHPLPLSKVMIVCSNCGKPTRIGHRTLENGRRVRVCKQCGEQMEAKS